MELATHGLRAWQEIPVTIGIGLLLQLAQIHAEYLGNRSFSREGAREKRARCSQKLPNLAAEIAAGGKIIVGTSARKFIHLGAQAAHNTSHMKSWQWSKTSWHKDSG